MAADKKPAELNLSEKEMESWFGMLDDASKAEVMKTKISTDATTEQIRIKETEQSRRQIETDDDATAYKALIRGLAIAAFVIACLCATCVGYNKYDNQKTVDIERIHAEHPGMVAPAASSAAPSK